MNKLAYKPCAEATLQRLSAFYERRTQDQILASFKVPSRTLRHFASRYQAGFTDYPDPAKRIQFWDEMLRENALLEDDSIPSAYHTEFDQGLYGGLLGGDVMFMAHPENGWISSMVAPILKAWPEFDSLRLDEGHVWFDRYGKQLEIFDRGSRGKFGISHFILIDGLNFVFELFGATETYLSLIDYPEKVSKAIEFALDFNTRIQTVFFDKTPLFQNGTCSNMGQWIPGRIISESVDPFHMTSVADFETWGRAPIEIIFSRFDGGVVHIHANGRHLLEAVCSLKGLKAIFTADDRGFAPSYELASELKRRTGEMPLIMTIDYPMFVEKLNKHRLQGGVFYQVNNTPSVVDANRLMEKVRQYRM